MNPSLGSHFMPDRLQTHSDDCVETLELSISDIDILQIEILVLQLTGPLGLWRKLTKE
jgi:hypothetical protein